MYKVNDKISITIAQRFYNIGNFEFNILDNKCTLTKGIKNSINNQQDYLRDENFFGRNLEYTLKINDEEYPIAFQFYENDRGHYRIFVFTEKGKMLTSVNLTTGLRDEIITFDIQIKITSPQSITKEERKLIRDECVKKLREYGLNVDKKNHVYLGEYDITSNKFVNITPKDLLINLLVIGIYKNSEIFNI